MNQDHEPTCPLEPITAQELGIFVTEHVSEFTNRRIEPAGTAFHYTEHIEEIERSGGLLGKCRSKRLAQLQRTGTSERAHCRFGVVYAYPQAHTACRMSGDPRTTLELVRRSEAEKELFRSMGILEEPIPLLQQQRRNLVEIQYNHALSAEHKLEFLIELSRQILILVPHILRWRDWGLISEAKERLSKGPEPTWRNQELANDN